MKQNDIDILPLLNNTNYENIFNIYQDSDSRYYYNLLQTVVVPSNIPDAYFSKYITVPSDTWPYISYKVFGRIDLWWIILLCNSITNPTIGIDTGVTLKIPKTQVVDAIIAQIQTAS